MSDSSEIRAIQDIGCLSAAKFFYYFPYPIPYEVIDGFDDCDIVARTFSKTIRSAKDLVCVKRQGEFSAEFIVGGTRAVVYFNGSAESLPRATLDAFAQRLLTSRFDRIAYSQGSRPQCGRCPAGAIKKCVGSTRANVR